MLLLGRSGTGKTYNGMKYVLGLVEKKIFSPKRVLIISATWKSDPSQQELITYCQEKYKKFKEYNCFEEIDLELLDRIFET
jgi:2-hydroxy-3-keto-5-methylthiopentenyl-1-phosphate phosphatase